MLAIVVGDDPTVFTEESSLNREQLTSNEFGVHLGRHHAVNEHNSVGCQHSQSSFASFFADHQITGGDTTIVVHVVFEGFAIPQNHFGFRRVVVLQLELRQEIHVVS